MNTNPMTPPSAGGVAGVLGSLSVKWHMEANALDKSFSPGSGIMAAERRARALELEAALAAIESAAPAGDGGSVPQVSAHAVSAFHDQDRFGGSDAPPGERGNCFQACLASMLGLPLAAVPHFMDTDETPEQQHANVARWAAGRGWCIVYITPEWLSCDWFALPSRTLLIASGQSPRGPWSHVVIGKVDGDGFHLIHDPHPDKTGIVGEPTGYYLVARLPELCKPATPAGGGREDVAEALWHRFGDDSRLTWDEEPEKAIYRDAAAQVIAMIRRLLLALRQRTCSHVFAAPDMRPRNAEGIVVWPCADCGYVARVPYGLAVPGQIVGPWGIKADQTRPTGGQP